jgi:predicted PurR-regulated permease PerM
MCKAKRLQARIDALQESVAKVCTTETNSVAKIAQMQSEIFVAATQLAEISTRRIVRLTAALFVLTAALLIFTAYLYKDTHTLIQREKAGSPDVVKHP